MRHDNASPASVSARILNEARKIGTSVELLRRRYVFERFLVRLAQSDFRDKFVLKGAMALIAVTRNTKRITRDMDILGLEKLTAPQALEAIKAIAAVQPSDPDPVVFDFASLKVEPINATAEEPGHQITGEASIGDARIPIKIEISHGHVVSPAPIMMNYPTVLPGTEPAQILCYTASTMLAEKFEAIYSLGVSTRYWVI